MEAINVVFDNDERFEEVVHGGLPEGADLEIVMKDRGTVGGAPAVAITFTVELPDGTLARAQCVTTARNLLMAAAAVRGRCQRLGITDL